MINYFDISFKSKFPYMNNGEWEDRSDNAKDSVRLTKEEAVKELYKTFENVYESRHGADNDGERFWKIIRFNENYLHIQGTRDAEIEHIWQIVPSKTRAPGFWVHDVPTDSLDRVVSFLNGDAHDQSKVEFVKNNKRYQVIIKEV
jgi:hypothetical protein